METEDKKYMPIVADLIDEVRNFFPIDGIEFIMILNGKRVVDLKFKTGETLYIGHYIEIIAFLKGILYGVRKYRK